MRINQLESNSDAIITMEEIKIILQRYSIGKKPLAKLLGWGETTIIRYMEGDIPTNEYSNKLKTILEDPKAYYDLLMKRKDCLTGVAFKKSKKAVLSKMMASKLHKIAYYIVNKCNAEISASYIQYLIYYIQAFSLALYDKEMFQEECMANNDHIPFMKLYERMRLSGIFTMDLGEDLFPSEEKQLIDSVCDYFSWYGPKALQVLMAHEIPFLKISKDKYNNKIFLKDSIKTYFKDSCEQYHIYHLKDISRYPERKLFEIKNQNKQIS